MYVLLVEDDPRVGRLVERALGEAGHRVELADDGADGLARAESGAYDLVVLDVMLPAPTTTLPSRLPSRSCSLECERSAGGPATAATTRWSRSAT
jgi:CheY-like chemotaxis protein